MPTNNSKVLISSYILWYAADPTIDKQIQGIFYTVWYFFKASKNFNSKGSALKPPGKELKEDAAKRPHIGRFHCNFNLCRGAISRAVIAGYHWSTNDTTSDFTAILTSVGVRCTSICPFDMGEGHYWSLQPPSSPILPLSPNVHPFPDNTFTPKTGLYKAITDKWGPRAK